MIQQPIVETTLPSTHNLRYWQDKLQKANLPVNAESKTNILRELNRPATNNQRIANIISTDPVLTLRIIMKANRRLATQQTEASSLLHAVSLLGISDVQQSAQRAEEFSAQDLARDAGIYGYGLALQQSLFAAQLNQLLHARKGETVAENAYLQALLSNAYQWGLWHIAPKHCLNLQGLLANPAYTLTEAEQLGLGCTLKQLFQSAINIWALPESLREAAQLNQTRKLRFLARTHGLSDAHWWDWYDYSLEARQLSQRPYWPALLCNQLVASAYEDWHSRQTLRWQKILGRLLSLPVDDVVSCCHRVAAQFEGLPGLKPGDHPAHRLLGRFKQHSLITPLRPRIEKSQTPAPEQATEITRQRFRNSALLQTNKIRLQERGAQFANLHQLMHVTLDTLRDGLGIEQVAILSLNKQHSLLQTRYHSGINSDEQLYHCQLQLTDSRSPLLQQLFTKPAGLLVTPSKLKHLQKSLPAPLAKALSQPLPADATGQFAAENNFYCALISVFYGKEPIALVCLRAPHISLDDYQECRQICHYLSLGIQAFATKSTGN